MPRHHTHAHPHARSHAHAHAHAHIQTIEWGCDDAHLYYLKLDSKSRPFQAWRHTRGASGSEGDELLYEENDELFWLGLSKTLDGQFIVIISASTDTSEVWYVDLRTGSASPHYLKYGREAENAGKATVLAPREENTFYEVDHRLGYWYIITNYQGNANNCLRAVPSVGLTADSTLSDGWVPVKVPPEDHEGEDADEVEVFGDGTDTSPGSTMVSRVVCFLDFLVVEGRQGGYTKVWVVPMSRAASADGARPRALSWHEVQFNTEACECEMR